MDLVQQGRRALPVLLCLASGPPTTPGSSLPRLRPTDHSQLSPSSPEAPEPPSQLPALPCLT
ncbi:hypothetical protein PCANC_26242 [Puccinia coronata f. sp. avenae]|uniref:Uncharacterized protein n=1 Tax=Puccinia coronata f. sp. avenae TaxID=200324 RepID=A0A2N5TIE6_9BASI|nr:hypothetical protein PCANC_26242 [Puccinia coronata f. sp. avenae]